jgi:hypothetical protein
MSFFFQKRGGVYTEDGVGLYHKGFV